MIDVFINSYERVDDLHRNGYKIIQNPENFCFGVDAVLLSDFAKAKKNEDCLDFCTGTGIIPILMQCKTQGRSFTGVEIISECVEMANRSIAMNEIEGNVKVIEGDIKSLNFSASSFDVITANPPYIEAGGGIVGSFDKKAIARHEILCTLEDIVSNASRLLKTGGRFYMIHKPHRLCEIFCKLREYKLEPKVVRFVHPKMQKEPTMVLVEASRSGKPFLKVLPPLIIYKDDGQYTDEIYKIYYE